MLQLRFNVTGICLCVILFGMNTVTNAQSSQTTYGTVTISSPTAASLGKYGDIPVGYHTGVPEINIPIYTVEAGPLKLPIGLNYHLSGIKVMEPSSWVGAGWSLNAGGMITRTVMGAPDEAGNSASSEQDGHFSNNGFNSYLYYGGQQDWQNFANGQKDGQPDLYTFNFNGYTGKFYFRDDRTPILVPEQDLQIIPSYSGGRSIDYFTIVTPDGTHYVFGNSPGVTGAVPIEVTNVYSFKSGPMAAPPTSSWFLNKIVSGDGQFTINLIYQAESYGFFTLSLFPIDPTNYGLQGVPGVDLAKDIITGVRLSQISFPNGTVTFQPGAARTDLSDPTAGKVDNVNTNATTLGAIQISDGNGYCKNFNFNYTYTQDNQTTLPTTLTAGDAITTDAWRLYLSSVQEVSCDGTASAPPYSFSYISPNGLPRRLSFAVDHWGYFNGATNLGLMPAITVNGNTPNGANAVRNASFPQLTYGSLSSIMYPTGGTTTFNNQAYTETVSTPIFEPQPLTTLNNQINGQGGLSDTQTFTSNGNQVNLQVYTTCQNAQSFIKITNTTTGAVVSSGYLPETDPYSYEGFNYIYSIGALPVGNYTATLTLINTAVGGYEVTVEQNAWSTESSVITVGGSRISSITNTDGISGASTTTNYSYTYPGGASSAILYSQPVYVQALRNDIIEQYGWWSASGFNTTAGSNQALGYPGNGGDYYISAGSLMPMATFQGAAMGYLYVQVSQTGNGSSSYQYYPTNEGYGDPGVNAAIISIQTPPASPPPNYPPAPLPFDYRKGELSIEQHFDNSGNLLKAIYYYPQYNTAPTLSTPAFIVMQRLVDGSPMYLGTNYTLNTVKKTSMQTIEYDYSQGGGANYITKTTTTNYGSNFHNQPTQIQTSTSMGNILTTNISYASDFRIASCDAISDCSTEYATACNTCQTTYNTANLACQANYAAGSTGLSQCVTTAVENEWQCNTNARTSYVSCRNTNYMGTNSLFSQCHVNAENGADATLKPILLLQDQYQNPTIETSDWFDAGLKHASFVQFTPSTVPAGYVYPGKTQLVNLQAPSTAFTTAAVSGSTIGKDSRYLDEDYYTFINGNPQQVTGHDGISTLYLWAYGNTRPIAKVANAAMGQIAYSSFEADEAGNWSYTGTATVDATAVTGAKSYNLSQPNGTISTSGLTASATYIVSYWSKTGSAYTVTGSTSTKQGKTVTLNGGNWTYFEHVVTGVTSVSVSGGGSIDELRLYPQNAQMTTYTYSPLLGITTQCDVGNRATYYHYDALGRVQYIQDQDGNFVKTYQYHYQGQ
jgi:hypothetical protein